ncbi:hypothetical protein, partial [Helicobacter suis]|uniref:hypothetical protein n=1 Tax=Helicobacter suis TaxID=104628 RepID=UPI002493380F
IKPSKEKPTQEKTPRFKIKPDPMASFAKEKTTLKETPASRANSTYRNPRLKKSQLKQNPS